MTQKIRHSTDFKPVHIDVYRFEPTKERDYWTLITSGMSNERQIQPEECAEHMSPSAEILMYPRRTGRGRLLLGAFDAGTNSYETEHTPRPDDHVDLDFQR